MISGRTGPFETIVSDEEWAGGMAPDGKWYEQIIDEKGNAQYLTRITKTSVNEKLPEDSVQWYATTTQVHKELGDGTQFSESPHAVRYQPMKRILWPLAGPLPQRKHVA